ncbi:MAG: hypothetical protein AAF481_00775 [Acidobacteriota bacterium]
MATVLGSSPLAALGVQGGAEVSAAIGEFRGWRFSMQVPHRAVVTFSSPVEDFALYKVKLDDEVLLSIYAGDHPDFPQYAPRDAVEVKEILDRRNVRSIRWVRDGLVGREVLVQLESGFPKRLHIAYPRLSREQETIAEAILQSLRFE